MKIRLSIYFLTVALVISLASCRGNGDTDAGLELTDTSSGTLLDSSEDLGQEYIDSLIFVGESTTYHLKSRGVLRGGTSTEQVWSPRSGTMMLDMSTKNVRIVYPKTGELLTIAEAAAKSKPKYIVFTFGLNGAVQNINKGAEYFKSCYLSLINSVRKSSPDTKIILQSAFPIAENMDMSNYSISLRTLNEYIDRINKWSFELAEREGLHYLDTASALKNSEGFLRYEYQNGDGHHLTTDAYLKILEYIRTHGYK